MAKIADVWTVDLRGVQGEKTKLVIAAQGHVPTAGWSDPSLSEYVYVQPPEDGIYEFDFIGKPPTWPSAQVVTPISASAITELHSDIKGIRVYSSGNSITVRLPTIGDPPKTDGDAFNISDAQIVGDQLIVDVSYSGGCARHDFELYWDGSYDKSNPPRANLRLLHNANGDPCEAIIQEKLRFDLFQLAMCVTVLKSNFGYEAEIPYGYAPAHSLTGDSGLVLTGVWVDIL